VEAGAWYAESVRLCYEYNLINGVSDKEFAPSANLSIAQAIALACRIHSIYTSGNNPVLTSEPGGAWYDPYVRYALANGIITGTYDNYNSPAARSEVAVIFARSLPGEALPAIRSVEDGAIPDVPSSAPYAGAVYLLYRAGVLSGNDDYGTFSPLSSIKRSEIAAICVRLAVPAERSSKALAPKPSSSALTATEIAEKCSPAVFFISVYGMSGNQIATGSGFFISPDGLALTNYHVAANSSCLTAAATDGTVYSSIDVIDADEQNDLALLRVKGVSNHPYIKLGDSSAVKQGQTVYAIGSPLGLSNTLTTGIVSNANRVLNGNTYIQFSAQISFGSSGGVLLNEYGEAIGVTCGAVGTYGDLNMAVPINFAKKLNTASTASLYVWSDSFYAGFDYAVDFGSFAGVSYVKKESIDWGATYTYSMADFTDSPKLKASSNYANAILYYGKRLQNAGLAVVSQTDSRTVYKNKYEQVVVNLDYSSFVIKITVTWIPQYYPQYPNVLDFGWYTGLDLAAQSASGSGVILKYAYSNYFTYKEMTGIADNYASILDDSGYWLVYAGKDGDDFYWLCQGRGLSIAILQNYTSVLISIDRY